MSEKHAAWERAQRARALGPYIGLAKTPGEALAIAAEILERYPQMHSRTAMARNSDNESVTVRCSAACKFCAVGLLRRLDYEQGTKLADDAEKLFKSVVGVELTAINDNCPTWYLPKLMCIVRGRI